MVRSGETYISRDIAAEMRRHGRRVWAFSLAVVFVWVFIIVAAPLAQAGGVTSVSYPLYNFFGFLCHQIDGRSFHIEGEKLAVCSRCFGVYFGLFLGFAVYPLWRRLDEIKPLPRFWLFLSLIPITIDWSLSVFGIWENTQWSRFITGLILGIACATFIVRALVEINWNFSYRRSEPPA